MKILLIYFILVLTLISCNHDDTKQRQTKMGSKLPDKFISNIFNRDKIVSIDIIDTLKIWADTIFADTASYSRTPKATIFVNKNSNSFLRVFENPKNTITALTYFVKDVKLNVAEYYSDGQIICKFQTNENGIRMGKYSCYFENGKIKKSGYYLKDKEVMDSLKHYD